MNITNNSNVINLIPALHIPCVHGTDRIYSKLRTESCSYFVNSFTSFPRSPLIQFRNGGSI